MKDLVSLLRAVGSVPVGLVGGIVGKVQWILRLSAIVPAMITFVELLMGSSPGAEKAEQAKKLVAQFMDWIDLDEPTEKAIGELISAFVTLFNALGIFQHAAKGGSG